jgi:prepilin-type N-terminal cleavage/methylation domain-containing protein
MRIARAPRGFTLLEVMIALALLGLGLTVLVKSAANSIFNTQQAHMMGVATDLARAKVYDLEEKLLKDGFSDTTQEEDDQPFTDEGWPQIKFTYKIEVVELPSWDDLQKLALNHAEGSGSGGSAGSGSASKSGSGSAAGSDGAFVEQGGFANSTLGGMLTQFGGFGGAGGGFTGVGGGSGGKGSGDINANFGASFVQSQYTMFQQILKASLRKVSLTVKWTVMGADRDMKVVAFFTDAAGMDKVISGMGSQDLDDANAAKGSGSGTNATKPPTTPKP